jgi:hypothetical protein
MVVWGYASAGQFTVEDHQQADTKSGMSIV